MSQKHKCVAWGWERESWPMETDGNGHCTKMLFSSVRLFWMWGADMKLSTFCVSDDEPEPTFEIVDAPFRVVECSLSNIEVEYSR